MSKKAEIQFYWIFTIIAGAIILAFLISFGLRFKDLQEEKTTIRVLNNLEESFSSLQGAQFQTSTSFNLPVTMNALCDSFGERLVINRKSLETNNLIFSNGDLKDDVLIGFTPHNLPFRISNFFYIIEKEDTYSLVYENSNERMVRGLGKEFKEYFPDNVEITNNPGNQVRVYFNKKEDADIYVIPETEESGKVFFKGGGSVDYYNKAMLYGAIVAREKSGCLFNKSGEEMREVIGALNGKIDHLPVSCNYNDIRLSLQKMEKSGGRDLVDATKVLERQNEVLLDKNCPLVF